MKFLMTYAASKRNAPPTPEHMAAIGKFSAEMAKSGILLMTGGLVRPSKGTQVKMASSKFTVTDGPFAESKELIDGFALVETKSKQEALDVCERFMKIAGDGDGELLQVFENGEGQPG